MRVLAVGNFYPPHDQRGGYEAVWYSAMEHLRAQGHQVRILASDFRSPAGPPDEPQVFRELRWYWQDHEFPRRSAAACLAIERHNAAVFARHVSDFAPDVVSWWSMGGMSMSLLEHARRSDLSAVAFVHDDWLDYGRSVDAWHRRFGQGVRALIAERLAGVPCPVDFARAARYAFVSDRTRAHALASGVSIPHWTVAHSGIAESFLQPAPESAWQWRLLYVGRIDPRKGIDTAVRALAELPRATLDIAGSGAPEEVDRLRHVASELGVTERVRLLGGRSKSELHRLYGAADAVVFPVVWDEPWGLVPLEAMARGRPVIATGRGGSSAYLREGDNCLLFAAEDAGALAAAVVRLADDGELRDRLRAVGLDTAARHTEPGFNATVEAELLLAAERTGAKVGSGV